jgi:dTMP kinase
VLCDRFYDSTTAYQGAGRALDTRWIERLNDFATGGITPDCTIVLHVPTSVGLQRATRESAPDRLESAGASFHEAVRKGFLELAKRHPQRIRIVDGDREKDLVSRDIELIVQEVLDRVR